MKVAGSAYAARFIFSSKTLVRLDAAVLVAVARAAVQTAVDDLDVLQWECNTLAAKKRTEQLVTLLPLQVVQVMTSLTGAFATVTELGHTSLLTSVRQLLRVSAFDGHAQMVERLKVTNEVSKDLRDDNSPAVCP